MTRIPEHLWPAQEPAVDFVESTVEHLLSVATVPPRRRFPARQVAWLLAAAILATGAAWGFVHAGTKVTCAAAAPQTQLPVAAPPKPTLSSPVLAPALPSAAPATKARPKAPAARRALPETLRPVASAPNPVPRVPPCGCERGLGDYICDCY